MRIIAGSARGIQLSNLPKNGDAIRPTLDRVREALFSAIGPRLEGARFLDLFAGTGANGIEALSRGAASATFLDNDAKALDVIRRNLEKTKLTACATILRATLPTDTARIAPKPYDIVFADPPYAFTAWEQTLEGLRTDGLLAADALVIYEHSRKTSAPANPQGLELTRTRNYGDSALSFYSII